MVRLQQKNDGTRRIAQAIFEATAYNEEVKSFSFDESKVINAGLPKDISLEIKNHLESLDGNDAEKVNQDQLVAQQKGKLQLWLLLY
nr:hypothetical protein [Bacillus pumilus]